MLSSHHSRPAFDLEGASTSATSSRQTRLHHSPSLPNIWFPPHLGPLPPDIPATDLQSLRRAPTPPAFLPQMTLNPSLPSYIPKPTISGTKQHPAAIEPRSHQASQLFRSSRQKKKSRMSYITPPSTPSSSIKTTTSIDSSIEDDDYFSDRDKTSTRFIALGGFDPEVAIDTLEASVLESLGDSCLGDIDVSFPCPRDIGGTLKVIDDRDGQGELVIACCDIRHARLAYLSLTALKSGRLLSFFNHKAKENPATLSVRYLAPEDVSKKITDPWIEGNLDGGFYVSAVPARNSWEGQRPRVVDVRVLKNYLRSFGDLQSFTFVRENMENKVLVKTFRVEYFNTKDAVTTYQSLNGQSVFGMTISVYGRPSQIAHPTKAWKSSPRTSQPDSLKKEFKADTATIYSSHDQRFSPASQFIGATAPGFDTQESMCAPQWEAEIQPCANPERNCTYCPSRKTPISHVPFHLPPTPSPPIGICPPSIPHMLMSPPPMPPQAIPIDYSYPHPMYTYPPWFEHSMPRPPPAVLPASPSMIPYYPEMPFWPDEARMHNPPFNFFQGTIEGHFPSRMPMSPYQLPPTPPSTDDRTVRSSSPVYITTESFEHLNLRHPPQASNIPSKNQLILQRIKDGADPRTTAMIKNIPNKMSDKDLLAYINKVCPRRIDFFYLRIDFRNGANVGYAFVNFIEAQDLYKFAVSRLGERWNMFSSDKVLQMSYAAYQGKEALVDKLKNSSVMDERESWRPKIYFSSGPNQGLPEPFPPPTHIGRKERSSFNRGALYVPGLHTRNTLNSPLSRDDHSGHRGPRRGNRAH